MSVHREHARPRRFAQPLQTGGHRANEGDSTMSSKIGSYSALVALAMIGSAAPALADFNYTNMSDITGLKMVGSAVQNGSAMDLTTALRQQSGAVWHESKQNISLGFDAQMTVRVPTTNGSGSDGFALVIQNSEATPLGGFGGGIGYGTNPFFPAQMGIANSIAIELDTFDNRTGWDDMGGSHVSVQSRGLLANSAEHQYSMGSAMASRSFVDGNPVTLRVRYTPGILDVFVDNLNTPLFSVNIDLSGLLALDTNGGSTAGQAFVGVTSATGGLINASSQQLSSFSFAGVPIPAPGSAAILGLAGLAAARRRRSV